jgi:hypothetical protein
MSQPEYMRWVEPLDNLVFQCWYRVLSFVSIHAPIQEVYQAAQYIAANIRGGTLYWVVKDYVARWENLDINPPYGIYITIWLSGLSNGKNTILCRVGWWTLYVFQSMGRAQNRIITLESRGIFDTEEMPTITSY